MQEIELIIFLGFMNIMASFFPWCNKIQFIRYIHIFAAGVCIGIARMKFFIMVNK